MTQQVLLAQLGGGGLSCTTMIVLLRDSATLSTMTYCTDRTTLLIRLLEDHSQPPNQDMNSFIKMEISTLHSIEVEKSSSVIPLQ